ncbi:hypothetical protein D8T52_08740, partial [Vibrio vulnificus]
SKFSMPKLFFSPIIIAFYHFRNPQLSPSVKDLIVKQEFSSKNPSHHVRDFCIKDSLLKEVFITQTDLNLEFLRQ